jgi:hypothetical protein
VVRDAVYMKDSWKQMDLSILFTHKKLTNILKSQQNGNKARQGSFLTDICPTVWGTN